MGYRIGKSQIGLNLFSTHARTGHINPFKTDIYPK